MKRIGFVALLALGGCALSGSVHRMGVEYNSAIAGMANELTLLNILRAKEGLPLHYTSISRVTGTLTVKTTAGWNGQFKEAAPTKSSSTSTTSGDPVTTVAAAGVSTVRGGNVYTPSIGGEIDSGPQFDIAILDSQAFYRAILSPIPFATIDGFNQQGFGDDALMALLVARYEITPKDMLGIVRANKAPYDIVIEHTSPGHFEAFGDDGNPIAGDAGTITGQRLACYRLRGAQASQAMSPLSRLTHDKGNDLRSLKAEDLSLLAGDKFTLKSSKSTGDTKSPLIPENDKNDKDVLIMKLGDQRLPRLVPIDSPECSNALAFPKSPDQAPFYLGAGKGRFLTRGKDHDGNGIDKDVTTDVNIELTFRSTEGLIRFIGDCLRLQETNGPQAELACAMNGRKVFVIHRGHGEHELAGADLMDQHYFVSADDALDVRRNTMNVIAMIEQLLNLSKSPADKPATLPVQVIP